MSYVVQQPCVGCKYGDCVEVCPVECFFEAEDMIVINPKECIDCDACVTVCPVNAIVNGNEADKKWIAVANEFIYIDDKRRTKKAQVAHGPNATL